MSITKIEKRDGKIVKFDRDKISNAIVKSMQSINDFEIDPKIVSNMTTSVVKELNKLNDVVDVETIQDIVENHLMKKYPVVAKEYIKYRNQRTIMRNRKSELMKQVRDIITCENIQNSNANVDEYSFGGRKKESSDVIQKELALNDLIDPEVAEAHREGSLYIHDLSEYAVGLHNCLFADLAKLLHDGFCARNGDVRGANSFATACQLTAVIFQIQSQNQFGGVASAHIDSDLAPYVRISFLKHFKKGLHYLSDKEHQYLDFINKYGDEVALKSSIDAEWNIFKDFNEPAYVYGIEQLEAEGLQSAQALYHNLNTLESRAGSQVPFTSINFGLNTTFEGQKVTEWLLKASIDGIGVNHITPIFPITCFQYKTDINDRPGTPNYHLKKLAIKSLVKRIYPNFVNADYESNIADIHPSYVINASVFTDIDDIIAIRIDSNAGSNSLASTAAFNAYDHSHTIMSEYKTVSIKSLIENIDPVFISQPNKDGLQIIDMRFMPERILIKDSNQKYNNYNIEKNDQYTKLNYLAVYKDANTVAITTESFAYDTASSEENTNGVSVSTVKHVQLPLPEYDYDTEMATMGCRTLLGYDVNGMGYKKTGRGNITPVTINLARIGIRHGICLNERTEPDTEGFMKELHHMLDLAERELITRYEYICSQNIKAGQFMYENGTIADCEAAQKDGIYKAMQHGTNALGYIGLANAMYAMFGTYPHKDKNVLDFSIKVIEAIYNHAKECVKKYHLNFSAYATPAESTCKTLAIKLQKEYGKIKNVCDRTYITNSHHVPVYEQISVKNKLNIESNYSWMATGGNITYVELSSGVIGNPKAVEKIIDTAMHNTRIPYLAINFPIDTCHECGYSGEIEESCPVCGSTHIVRLRRVTGYLSQDYRKFNKGKFDECNDRVKHM